MRRTCKLLAALLCLCAVVTLTPAAPAYGARNYEVKVWAVSKSELPSLNFTGTST